MMTTPNPLLDTQLAMLAPTLEPLPAHITVPYDLELRQSYATLLAALLTSQQSISEGQQQLFTRLSGAMDLAQWQASLLAQSQALELSVLADTLKAMRTGGFALPLLTEAILLLRIDGPLDAVAAGRLAQLAQCLGASIDMQNTASQWAAAILGLEGWGQQLMHTQSVSVPRPPNDVFGTLFGHLAGLDKAPVPEVVNGQRITQGAVLMKYRKQNEDKTLRAKSAGLVFFNMKTFKDRRDYKFVIGDFPESLQTWRDVIDFAALAKDHS